MKDRKLALTSAIVLFCTSMSGAACDSSTEPGSDGPASKIDPPVAAAMRSQAVVPVLILGQAQLLGFPDGFSEFRQRNAGRDRRALRGEVIDELKRIAATGQAEILDSLGDSVRAQSVWIVNGILAALSSEEIQRAAALSRVRYIYHAGRLRFGAGEPGAISTVLSPSVRPPFSAAGKRVPWNLEAIRADRVWSERGVTGEGVVVAVLDVGANYTHVDLRNNIWINEDEVPNNGTDDDGNGYADDYYGFDFRTMQAEVRGFGSSQHGTYVSGIIAGDGTAGIVTGVAPRARLMLLIQNSLQTAILAHQYALENGADIMNMSFSIPNLGNVRGVWRLMSEQAAAAGLVLVSGAGNFRRTEPVPMQLRIPEGIPSVLAVGGVDRELRLTSFSSMGPVEWSSVRFYNDFPRLTKPDLAGFPGPGYPILGHSGSNYIDPNLRLRGNSFSGPHASGAAALLLSAVPGLPAWRVKEILEATARDLPPLGKDNGTGSGLIDAFTAVEAAARAAN